MKLFTINQVKRTKACVPKKPIGLGRRYWWRGALNLGSSRRTSLAQGIGTVHIERQHVCESKQ